MDTEVSTLFLTFRLFCLVHVTCEVLLHVRLNYSAIRGLTNGLLEIIMYGIY